MLSFQQLEDTVSEFLKYFSGDRFDFSEICDFLFEKFPAKDQAEQEQTEKKLRNILDSSDDGLARTFHGDTFYILDRYLKGLVFRCKPRPFEIEEGILVPGARFEPFHSQELFLDDLEISSGCGAIRTRDYTAAYEQVEELYFLLGPGGTLDMFYAENQNNADSIMAAGGLRGALRLTQTVFDFREFYQKNNFRNGDILKFTIDSFMDGTYHVEHEPRPDAPSGKDVEQWITKFERYLGNVCRDYKDSFDIPAQILYAYIYGEDSGTDLRKLPAPSIDTYHTMMQNIEFQRNGVDWILTSADTEEEAPFPQPEKREEKQECSCGHEHGEGECSCGHEHGDNEEDLSADQFTISAGSLESMDAIYLELKTDFRESEFRAAVFDAIASGVESFDEFSRVYETMLDLPFQDEAQKAVFFNFAEDIWEYTQDIYSHNIDARKAPLRQRLLEINTECAELQKAQNSNEKNRKKLNEIRHDIRTTLALLSSDSELEENALESLELRIGDIEDSLEDFA